MTKFDYETKIYGMREDARLGISSLEVLYSLPREFEDVRGKVLDIGCGAGAFTGIIKHRRPDLEVYGVDISKKAIALAKKDFPDISFSVASAYRLPFHANFFDVGLAHCVLEHLEDPDKALTELRRVVKPGGLFYSVTPLEEDKFVLNPPKELSKKYHGHLQRFSRVSLLSLLEKNGFRAGRYYFGGFLFCQVIGTIYLFLLDLLNLPPEFSVKSYITRSDCAPGKLPLSLLRKAVSFLLNIESRLVPKRIPGFFMHIIAYKV